MLLISILHQRNFFAKITPVNFNTVATPHIGIIRYPSFFSRLASIFFPRILSRTGEQIYARDKWSNTGKALLEVMADPGEERFLDRYCTGLLIASPEHVFYKGLKLFPHVRIYANM